MNPPLPSEARESYASPATTGGLVNEVVPILLGVGSGALIGAIASRPRARLWLTCSIALGLAATVLTGEWRTSWGFVLIDIPLVAVSSAGAFLALRAMRYRLWQSTEPGT